MIIFVCPVCCLCEGAALGAWKSAAVGYVPQMMIVPWETVG